MYCFIPKGVKSSECANVNCGHDAGCRAAPGGGFICVCDYHGTIKEELGKRCVLPEGKIDNPLFV